MSNPPRRRSADHHHRSSSCLSTGRSSATLVALTPARTPSSSRRSSQSSQLFTPISATPAYAFATPTHTYTPKRSRSTPHLASVAAPPPYRGPAPAAFFVPAHPDCTSEDDPDMDDPPPAMFAFSSRNTLRMRTPPAPPPAHPHPHPHLLSETEDEDHSQPLPTARIVPPSTFSLPPAPLELIYTSAACLSFVPALLGTLHLLRTRPPDHFLAVLWALLTAFQAHAFTSGLLARWRTYYAPLPTLVRLLGLQAICWPATHLTLLTLAPLPAWMLIGSTTCVSRAIQTWVTSNLEGRPRRWDWPAIGAKCAAPAAVLYLVTAWTIVIQRELAPAPKC